MSESIFRVKLLPDGNLEYEDCRGNVGACAPLEIGQRIVTVLRDPNLPPVERVGAGGYNLVEAAARTMLPPELAPVVSAARTPIMQLFEHFKAIWLQSQGRGRRAYHYQQQQQQPPGPNAHARPGAYRRGRRVA